MCALVLPCQPCGGEGVDLLERERELETMRVEKEAIERKRGQGTPQNDVVIVTGREP